MPILDPNQNHFISLDDACELTSRYRNSTQFNGLNGGFFGKTAIQDILDQQDCAGIRYYYGLDAQNTPVMVIVGVTEDNIDIADGELAELSVPCPNLCDDTSPLTGN